MIFHSFLYVYQRVTMAMFTSYDVWENRALSPNVSKAIINNLNNPYFDGLYHPLARLEMVDHPIKIPSVGLVTIFLWFSYGFPMVFLW